MNNVFVNVNADMHLFTESFLLDFIHSAFFLFVTGMYIFSLLLKLNTRPISCRSTLLQVYTLSVISTCKGISPSTI